MRSLFAGIAAAGIFTSSIVATVESTPPTHQIAQSESQAPRLAAVSHGSYNLFDEHPAPVQAAQAIVGEVKELAANLADHLVVVSMPDDQCPACKMLHPELDKLMRSGYNIDLYMTWQYRKVPGHVATSRYPTLLYYNGQKLIKRITGYQSANTIKETLVK